MIFAPLLSGLLGLPRETLLEGWEWAVFGNGLLPFSPFCRFHARFFCAFTSLMEDQSVKVVGEVGQREFGSCLLDADGAEEEAIAVLLVCENMLAPR